jgi:hypothetical protein
MRRSVVGHLVDRDRQGEEQGLVFSRGDLHPVCIARAEPLLRHRHRGAQPRASCWYAVL